MQNFLPAQPIARSTLHDEVVARLRDLIVEGTLLPGDRVNERELCERFAVSRTPLREALKVLASEGLIEILPSRGARIARLTQGELRGAFEVIASLEALAGRLACERISEAQIERIAQLTETMRAAYAAGDRPEYFQLNERIHGAIMEAAQNPLLANTYRTLSARIRRARYLANFSPVRWDEAMREHDAIVRTLRARDGAALAALMERHVAEKCEVALANFGAD